MTKVKDYPNCVIKIKTFKKLDDDLNNLPKKNQRSKIKVDLEIFSQIHIIT